MQLNLQQGSIFFSIFDSILSIFNCLFLPLRGDQVLWCGSIKNSSKSMRAGRLNPSVVIRSFDAIRKSVERILLTLSQSLHDDQVFWRGDSGLVLARDCANCLNPSVVIRSCGAIAGRISISMASFLSLNPSTVIRTISETLSIYVNFVKRLFCTQFNPSSTVIGKK